jgi:predicted dehydrogenase
MLHFGNRDSANEIVVRGSTAFGSDAAPFTDYPAGHVEGFPDTFKMLFRSVYTAIARGKGEALFASAADGHHEVKICEAILKSHRLRRWIAVNGEAQPRNTRKT